MSAGLGSAPGMEPPERAPAERRESLPADHYYRVFVGGYVFPNLPAGTSDEDVKRRAKAMVEDGELDVTQTTVEAEFDD